MNPTNATVPTMLEFFMRPDIFFYPNDTYYGFGGWSVPLLKRVGVLEVKRKVESSSYLKIRLDILYSVYVVFAVDARTGKERWRVNRPHVISGYSTPTIWRPKNGGPVQILIPESFQLTSYSLESGKQLWYVRGLACEMKSVASPM